MGKWWAGSPNYSNGNYGRHFLFPHWTVGGFDGSVATLQNPSRQASAHYVIEGDNIAQLVSEDNTAWHCGNGYYNWRSISYEMVGWPGNPPSRETLDSTAALMAEASRAYFGGARLVIGENVMLHNMVYATSCPGESDVDYLVSKANEILGQGIAPTPPTPPSSENGSDFDGGAYVCNANRVNVRDYPGLGGAVVAAYTYGQTVTLDNWYTIVDGYVWGRYTSYSGNTRYIAVGPHTGAASENDFLIRVGGNSGGEATPPPSHVTGQVTVTVDSLNVRDAPSMGGSVVASYSRGQTLTIDSWIGYADGYAWARYLSYSGNTRYIARGTADGTQSYLA